MTWHSLYIFFNNSSVAGLITILSGGIIGVWTFWKQRKQTKIENLSENIETLVDKCQQVNFILDRISCTYINLKDKFNAEKKGIFIESTKSEFSNISLIINEEIPRMRAKIKNYTGFYFSPDEKIINNMIKFFEELKIWHGSVADIVFVGYKFDKRINDNKKFDLKDVQDSAKIFVDSLR